MMRRFFCLLSMLLLLPALATAQANPKYAGFVFDADTGVVYYSDRANAIRHPASLTKMMTLYLTFDALRKKQISPSSKMYASSLAAKQPQTNISLKKGQAITVDQAIRALVVRSANDASVVLAEKLGGSVPKFANKMNDMARALGMTQTRFKNPHGLPNHLQVTTARDMARLGAALRKDFPQYYHYFNTTKFSFNRKEFKSHNKVMQRYAGSDGIKTGYIRASGFNLVTSVNRDGRHMIGVVMGGKSSRSRDSHMVELLNNTFAQISRENEVRVFAGMATPRSKYSALAALGKLGGGVDVAKAKSVALKKFLKTPRLNPKRTHETEFVAKQAVQKVASHIKDWGIQVGAYRQEDAALKAAAEAVRLAQSALASSQIAVTDSGSAVKNVHRAKLANLSESQARDACRTLIAANTPCFAYRAQ